MAASSSLKLTLRQKPHLDWISQGFAGLLTEPASGQARIEGTVEVRVVQQAAIAAAHVKLVKVELKKTETVLTSKGVRRYFELIGAKEQIAWEGTGKPGVDREGFAPLESSDHAFSIPVPAGLPPSIALEKNKGTGIIYHLVVTATVKPRAKSLFGGTSSSFKAPITITHLAEVTIEKHELNPTWPIYTFQAESENLNVNQGNLSMKLRRETVCVGAGDAVTFHIDMRSERIAPVKITRLELTLREIIITRETGPSGPTIDPRKTISQSTDVVSTRLGANSLLYQNERTSHTLTAMIPTTHQRFSVQNAKHLEVKYFLRLRAVVEIPKEAKQKKGDSSKPREEPVKELVLDNVPVLVSPWNKKSGEWWKQKIGQTPRNLDRPNSGMGPSASATLPQVDGVPLQVPQQSPQINGGPPQALQQPNQSPPVSNEPVRSWQQFIPPDTSPASPVERPAEWATLPIPAMPPSAAQQAQLDRDRERARQQRPVSMAGPPTAAAFGHFGPQADPRQRRQSLDAPKLYVPRQTTVPAPLAPAPVVPMNGNANRASSISPPLDARKDQPTLPQSQQQQQQQQQQNQPQMHTVGSEPFKPASAPPVPVHLDGRRLSTLQRTNPRSIPYSSTASPDPAVPTSQAAAAPAPANNTSAEGAAPADTARRGSESGAPRTGGVGSIPAAVFTGRHLSSFRPYSPQFMVMKQQHEEALKQQQQPQPSSNAIHTNALASQSMSALPQSASEPKLYAPQAQHAPGSITFSNASASQSVPDLSSAGAASPPLGASSPITQISSGRSPIQKYSRSDSGHGISPSTSFNSIPYRANTTRAGVMSWHGQAAQMQSFRAGANTSPPPMKMDGAYPAIPTRSPSASSRNSMGVIDLTRSMSNGHFSTAGQQQQQGRRTTSESSTAQQGRLPQTREQDENDDREEIFPASPVDARTPESASPNGRYAVSAVPIAPQRRRDTLTPPVSPVQEQPSAIALDRRKAQSDYGMSAFPSRSKTLSTITASPASSPATSPIDLAEVQSSSSSPLPQREWLSAEQEKERLYQEAVERARKTQEAAGNSIPAGRGSTSPSINTPETEEAPSVVYKSVEGRSATPLSLMRTMSNPGPVRQKSQDFLTIEQALRPNDDRQEGERAQRDSVYSAHLPYLASQSVDGHDVPRHGSEEPPIRSHQMYGSMSDIGHAPQRHSLYAGLTSNGPPPVLDSFRPHNRLASDSSFQSTASRSSTQIALDQQKVAYLKALAAREAYQQRRQGGEAAPLTALEEKERLRKQYEEEERAANTSADSQYTVQSPREVEQAPFAPSNGPLYSPGSVYLTPGTSLAQNPLNASVEYFDQHSGNGGHASNSSSSLHHPSASEQSHTSSSSVISPGWQRNPSIAKGKQRRYPSYIEEDDDAGAGGAASSAPPPMRPPKPKEVLRDEYSYLDTPISPGAAEYQRQFFFKHHGMSDSSHHGH